MEDKQEKEDIATRLQNTSKICLDAYNVWNEKQKDKPAQEDLHAAIHELRKVSSRLEIELAVSEREQMVSKPLPIPSHRSSNKNVGTSILNQGASESSSAPVVQKSAPRRRRPPTRKQGD